MFESNNADAVILQAIGQGIASCRLAVNMTQARLAEEAGVSKRTIERVESGESVQLTNLIRILRVQGKLPLLEQVFPDPAISPLQQLSMRAKQKKTRQRAYTSSTAPQDAGAINEPRPSQPWKWGDE